MCNSALIRCNAHSCRIGSWAVRWRRAQYQDCLRDRGLGQDLNLTAGQSVFNRLGGNERNQLAGRAAAYGLDSDQLQRRILQHFARARGKRGRRIQPEG